MIIPEDSSTADTKSSYLKTFIHILTSEIVNSCASLYQ